MSQMQNPEAVHISTLGVMSKDISLRQLEGHVYSIRRLPLSCSNLSVAPRCVPEVGGFAFFRLLPFTRSVPWQRESHPSFLDIRVWIGLQSFRRKGKLQWKLGRFPLPTHARISHHFNSSELCRAIAQSEVVFRWSHFSPCQRTGRNQNWDFSSAYRTSFLKSWADEMESNLGSSFWSFRNQLNWRQCSQGWPITFFAASFLF